MGKSYIWYSKPKEPRDPSLARRILAFFDKLTADDEAPGLHIEPVKNSADPRARTGRVDLNYRALLFKLVGEPTSYVVHGIYPHDEAYEVAAKVKLSLNPVNGMPGFHEVATRPPTPVPPTPVGPQAPKPLIAFSAADLVVTLGLPPDVAERACQLTAAEAVEAYADQLPEWQGLALLGLASGTPITEVAEELELLREPPEDLDQRVAAFADPPGASDAELLDAFHQRASLMTFAKLEGADELRRIILGGDFSAWQVFLHPQQRRWVERDWNGPFRLAGGAGTGKTVVVVHRARRLAGKGDVIVTTFTKNLATELERNLRRLDPGVKLTRDLPQGNRPGVLVCGIDALASRVLRAASAGDVTEATAEVLGVGRDDVHGRTAANAWQAALDMTGEGLDETLRRPAFLQAEYELVILPARITTETGYLRVPRPGRGVRLTRAARKAVWAVVEAYRSAARMAGTVDYAEAAAIAAAYLNHHPLTPAHVLVDEGQDFRPCHWQLVRALAPEGPNDIFIAEDAHQRIYGHRVVLSNFGIATRGRSRKLRLNYRTTRQNLAWAVGVLEGQGVVDSDGDEEDMRGYVSARSGPTPLVKRYANLSEELDAAADTLRGWLQSGAEPGSVGVLVRDRYMRDCVVAGLDERGVRIRALETGAHPKNVPVALTMHRAKGMEFAKVLIAGVSNDSIPTGLGAYDYDQAELGEAMLRERSLLYVAATRARDELVISYNGQRSALLP